MESFVSSQSLQRNPIGSHFIAARQPKVVERHIFTTQSRKKMSVLLSHAHMKMKTRDFFRKYNLVLRTNESEHNGNPK